MAIAALWLFTVDARQALAAAPANDLFTAPVIVPGLPFNDTVDTTEATTDADDAQLNTICGAPATDASVWYSFTPTEDSIVVVDVSASSYSAGVLVGLGNQAEDIVTCGPDTVGFFAAAGVTYHIMAIDDQDDGGGNGGILQISLNLVEAPTVDITVNSSGQFNSKTGTATISGTYTCSNGDFIDVSGSASQHGSGRNATILGYFFFSGFGTCDGAPHDWSAEVFPQSGKFKGGKSLTVTFTFTCGLFQCADGYVEQTVQLRGGGKASKASIPNTQLFLPSIVTRE
jgi:hypothetical protein